MKPHLFLRGFAVIACISFSVHSTSAAIEYYDDTEHNIRYAIDTDEKTAEVYGPIAFYESITNLVIPDYIDYGSIQIPVTSIKDYAFMLGPNVEGSLTIGNNVQIIGKDAFSGCSGFTGSLSLGSKVQTIESHAFLTVRALRVL